MSNCFVDREQMTAAEITMPQLATKRIKYIARPCAVSCDGYTMMRQK